MKKERDQQELIEAIRYSVTKERISTADLQKKFLKGFNWASSVLEEIEELNIF